MVAANTAFTDGLASDSVAYPWPGYHSNALLNVCLSHFKGQL